MTEMKALRAHQTTLQSDMRIVKKSKTTMRKRLNDTIVEVARVATATEAMAHKANGTAAAAAASTLPPSSSPVPADPVHIPTKVPWAKGMMVSKRFLPSVCGLVHRRQRVSFRLRCGLILTPVVRILLALVVR